MIGEGLSDSTVETYAKHGQGDVRVMALELLALRQSRRRTAGELAALVEKIDNAIAASRE
jgi:hypothetical protein